MYRLHRLAWGAGLPRNGHRRSLATEEVMAKVDSRAFMAEEIGQTHQLRLVVYPLFTRF